MSRLEEIRKRLEAATPGPWDSSCYNENNPSYSVNQSTKIIPAHLLPGESIAFQIKKQSNAEFIAHAPEDIRWLLNEINKLQEEVLAEHQAAVDMFIKKDTLQDKLKIAEEALGKIYRGVLSDKSGIASEALAKIRGEV